MLIDSHAHLNFEDFSSDYQDIIDDCKKNDIWLINVGSQLATSRRAVEIAEQSGRGVYAAVGLHPIHVPGSDFRSEEFNPVDYKNLIQSSKKVVAIGETGLDFFHSEKNSTKQKEIFIQHLNLAKDFNLPVIIHGRNRKDDSPRFAGGVGNQDAYDKILKILTLRQAQGDNLQGVIHCYGGSLGQAKAFLDLGFYIGFTGVVTFNSAKNLAAIARELPLDSILIETDCPYLAPEPHRGERNQPQYVKFVAEKIAEIKQIDYNKVVEHSAKNAIKLFNLD